MEYEKYLELNRDEMIESLRDVLRSRSEETESCTGRNGEVYPFGAGVQEAFEKVLALGERLGFETVNVDNYGGHIDFKGSGDKVMAIIGHLDVVPAGSDWDFDPYGAELKDGNIYGRGTTDDKGPVISCLYAMKALKDAGYKPECTIRLILGLDEETKWRGMDHYFKHVEKPDFGFTPDADFPVINGEKGMLIFDFAKKFDKSSVKGLELRSIEGGTAPNSVADSCRTVVRSEKSSDYEKIKEMAASYREKTGYKLNVKGVGKSLEITSAGKSAHGAKPEDGLNAISIMMDFLAGLNDEIGFANADHAQFIEFYKEHIGFCLNGENMGVELCDEESGKLVFNVGMIALSDEAVKLTINIRYPVTADGNQILDTMAGIIEGYNMGLVIDEHRAPIYFEPDSQMIKLLMEIYRKHTSDTESQPQVIGGGTYARCAKNIIAYGALFPGDEDRMHQKNEFVSVERFELMTRIFAEAIYKLSTGEYNM